MVALTPNLTSPTVAAINAALEDRQRPRQQRRLSGSMIGKKCEREIWYQFRWSYEPERFSGRMLRLFETGHLREPRAMRELQNVGVKLSDVDPETGDQWTFTELDGHFVVKIDGRGTGFIEAPKTEHIIGIKTMKDAKFKELVKGGIAVAYPEHIAQAQSEMHCSGIHRFFYYAVNKDTDELYAGSDVRIRYDDTEAVRLMVKAERVLKAIRPPEPISDDRKAFACRFCKAKAICVGAAFAPRSCRTCLHSTPVMGGDAEWQCEKHGVILSVKDQEAGCGEHLFIPELVPGHQVDVAPDGSSVTYEMPDGSQWIDGVAQEAA